MGLGDNITESPLTENMGEINEKFSRYQQFIRFCRIFVFPMPLFRKCFARVFKLWPTYFTRNRFRLKKLKNFSETKTVIVKTSCHEILLIARNLGRFNFA